MTLFICRAIRLSPPAAKGSGGRCQPDLPAPLRFPDMKRAGVAYYLDVSGRLIENPGALPLAYAVDASGRFSGLAVSLPRPERWQVRGRLPAAARKIVVSLPRYPGWRAWLNGVSVALEPHDYFVSLTLPDEPRAAHAPVSLDVEFEPSHWALLTGLSAASWLLLAGLCGSLRGAAGGTVLKQRLSIVAGLAVTALFLWLAVRNVQVAELIDVLKAARWRWLLVMVPLFLVDLAIRAALAHPALPGRAP